MDMEKQKQNFKNHKATFTDYGNIKILDFAEPGTSHYRIRFLFEEDYYRLHISGDLGHLVATNYNNMCWKWFGEHYTNNIGYFVGKIDCHDRPIYAYSEDEARKYLAELNEEYELLDDDDDLEEFINNVLEDFSDERGISQSGYDALNEVDPDCFEYAGEIGKYSTKILDLYMLAFKLACDQLSEVK